MKTVILCCASLEKEVRLAMARKEISYPLHILTDNNHDVPNRLREAIQRELDGIQDADRVLMAFGTCGGAMVGLRTGNFQLILPRVDDCLSLLMGSMEQRYAALRGGLRHFPDGELAQQQPEHGAGAGAHPAGLSPQAGGDDHPADVPEF